MLLKNITRLCAGKGISISRLERETGINNGTISRWGVSSPTVDNAGKVARYLGTTLDALLREEPAPEGIKAQIMSHKADGKDGSDHAGN